MKNRVPIFGKTEAEQNFIVEWQKYLDPELISYGAIPISTEGSLDSVVDRIITKIT